MKYGYLKRTLKMFEYFRNREIGRDVTIVWEDGNKMVIGINLNIPENLRGILASYYCGYVAMDKKIFDGIDIKEFKDEIDVHGGITFIEIDGDYIIFGFDCAHADDMINPKTLGFAINETNRMENNIWLNLNQVILPV